VVSTTNIDIFDAINQTKVQYPNTCNFTTGKKEIA
jgi:hypothetical protein